MGMTMGGVVVNGGVFGRMNRLTLGRTYWRLATRIASLIRTILDVMKRQSKYTTFHRISYHIDGVLSTVMVLSSLGNAFNRNWNEMIQLVLRLANVADASTSARSIPSSSSSLVSSIEVAESIITRVRDGITRMSTSPPISTSSLPWNSQPSSPSSSSSSSSSLPKRSTSDIVNTASRPPFTTLRSSL
jgi:hypothetical protein